MRSKPSQSEAEGRAAKTGGKRCQWRREGVTGADDRVVGTVQYRYKNPRISLIALFRA